MIPDPTLVSFLQWATPRLGLRWRGFRRVRRQVKKRLARRITELGIADLDGYRDYLERTPDEWPRFDVMCRITISRFFRNRGLWEQLEKAVLPSMPGPIRAWSAGCASGEEPYSLSILATTLQSDLQLEIVATDANAHMLARARAASYPRGSIREVPPPYDQAFERDGHNVTLDRRYAEPVTFECRDLRDAPPPGRFDLIFCRNLAFTYFDEETQRRVAERLRASLTDRGLLIVGSHETPPLDDRWIR